MSTAESLGFDDNQEHPMRFEKIDGEQLDSILHAVDIPKRPLTDTDKAELVADIFPRLQDPSFDLYIGIMSGLSVRTGLIEEAHVSEFVKAAAKVKTEILENDPGHTLNEHVVDQIADIQDEMLNDGRASAEILLDVVIQAQGQKNHAEAIYLNRFFLLTIASLTERL